MKGKIYAKVKYLLINPFNFCAPNIFVQERYAKIKEVALDCMKIKGRTKPPNINGKMNGTTMKSNSLNEQLFFIFHFFWWTCCMVVLKQHASLWQKSSLIKVRILCFVSTYLLRWVTACPKPRWTSSTHLRNVKYSFLEAYFYVECSLNLNFSNRRDTCWKNLNWGYKEYSQKPCFMTS